MRTLLTLVLVIALAAVAVLAFFAAVGAADAGFPSVCITALAVSLISFIYSVALLTGDKKL